MSSLFFQDRVFVLRAPIVRNRAGEEVRNYAGLESAPGYPRDLVHCRPVDQADVAAADRDTSVSEWRIATQPGSGDWDVAAGDWIRLPDGTITVLQGDPAKPTDPLTGTLDHVEVRVRRAAG